MSILRSVGAVAEARVRASARQVQRKALFGVVAALFGVMALVFGLIALTLGLADWLGVIPALLMLCAISLAGTGIALALLASETRKARLLAARRAPLDRELARAALFSAAPLGVRRLPRGLVGLGLVALGALLVVTRSSDRDRDLD